MNTLANNEVTNFWQTELTKMATQRNENVHRPATAQELGSAITNFPPKDAPSSESSTVVFLQLKSKEHPSCAYSSRENNDRLVSLMDRGAETLHKTHY